MRYLASFLCWLLGYLTWWTIAWYGKRHAKLFLDERLHLPYDPPGPQTASVGELVTRNDFAIEETRVTPVASWPPRIAFEVMTPKCCFRGWLTPMQAHALSNDLLRAVSTAKRKDPERKEAG